MRPLAADSLFGAADDQTRATNERLSRFDDLVGFLEFKLLYEGSDDEGRNGGRSYLDRGSGDRHQGGLHPAAARRGKAASAPHSGRTSPPRFLLEASSTFSTRARRFT